MHVKFEHHLRFVSGQVALDNVPNVKFPIMRMASSPEITEIRVQFGPKTMGPLAFQGWEGTCRVDPGCIGTPGSRAHTRSQSFYCRGINKYQYDGSIFLVEF